MKHARCLSHEEALVIEQAAESWLRLRDVEFNAAEYAAALLAGAVLREEGCEREDVASLGRTMLLKVPGEPEVIPIRLVRPEDEDLRRGHVSVLSELGLASIGKTVGSEVRIPHGRARLVGFADRASFAVPGCAGATP